MNTKNTNPTSYLKSSPKWRAVFTLFIATALLNFVQPMQAGDVVKANNTDNLNLGSSWVGGVAPTNLDVAVWDSTVTSNTSVLLGADTSWQGIRVSNAGGAPTINTNATVTTLTNGIAGIDMSSASTNLTINAPMVLTDTQTWNVASNRSLTVAGTVAALTNSQVTKSGDGVLVMTGGNFNNVSNLVISGGSLSTVGATSFTLNRMTFSNSATFNNAGGNNPTWQFSNLVVASDSIVNINYGPRGAMGRAGAPGGGNNLHTFGTNVTINARVDTTIDRNFLSGDWSAFSGTINIIGNSTTARLNIGPNSGTLSFNTLALTNAVIRLSSSNPGTNFITLSGTLNSGGNTLNIGALIGTADSFVIPAANGAATWSIGALNSNTTFAGSIQNNGATFSRLTKVGTGAFILTGNNTYTGMTTVAGGTLQIGVGGTSGAIGTAPITNNANLVINRSGAYTLTNNIAGTGTVVQAGSGTLTMLGANTYTGVTAVIAGVLSVSGDANLGAPPLSPTAGSVVINGGALSVTTGFTLDANRGIAVGPTTGSGSGTISVANGQTLIYNGIVADNGGTGTLIKDGAGVLELGGTSTYTGGTTVGGGALKVSGGLPGDLAVASGGTLGGTGTVSGAVTVQSGGTVSPGSSVGTLNVGSLTMSSGSIYNFEFGGTNDAIVVTASDGLTVNGGAFNLYQENTILGWTTLGTYNLIQFTGTAPTLDSGWTTTSVGNPHVANPQSGYAYAFDISGGWLRVTIAAGASIGIWGVDSDGNWSLAGNWTAVSGIMPPSSAGDVAILGVGTALRTVTLNANETVGGLSFTNPNSFVIAKSGANTLTLNNSGGGANVAVTDGSQNDIRPSVSLSDKATVSVSSGKSLTVSGPISGTITGNTLNVVTAGTTILTGTNTYGPVAGFVGTTLSGGGTLQLGNSGALGSGDVSVASSAAIKALGSFTVSNNFAMGTITTVTTIDDSGNSVTLQGVISGTGGWLTKIGTGTLTLNSANTYFNNTTISDGTLKLGVAGGIPSGGSTTGWLVLDGGDSVAGTFDLNGFNQAVNALSGLASNVLSQIVNNSGGTNTLTASNGPAISTIFAGLIKDNNNATLGKVALTLAGPGTLTLSGANTYSGGTTVSNGTLRLSDNSALGSGTLTMSGGNLDSTVSSANNNVPQKWNTNFTFLGTSGLNIGNGAVSLGATCQVTVSANQLTVGGPISGSFGLTKAGGGTLTLKGSSSYSGDTQVGGGVLEVIESGVISGAAANVSSVGGAQLVVRAGGSLYATTGSIGTGSLGLLADSFVSYSGALSTPLGNNANVLIHVASGTLTCSSLTLGRTATFSATQPIEGFTTVGLYVEGGTANIVGNLVMGDNAAANSTVNARIGNGALLKVGGSLVVGLNNTGRWSIMDVNGGTLTVGDTTTGISLGSSQSGNAILMVQNGGMATTPRIGLGQGANTGTSVINLTGGTLLIGSGGIVQVSTNVATGIWLINPATLAATNDWSSSVSMTVSDATIQAADSVGTARNITLSGGLNGTSFTKTGTGILTLAGTNTYDSGVNVNAGTLRVDGSVASFVNVNGGASLGGVGTINSVGTLSGGATLTPGSTLPGTLTVTNDLTLDASTVLDFRLGVNQSKVVVGNTLNFNLNKLNIIDSGNIGAGVFTLFTAVNPINDGTGLGTFNSTANPTLFGSVPNAGWGYLVNINPGSIVLTISNAPPLVNFSGTPTNGTASLNVSFTNLCDTSVYPILSQTWNFGDGATSTAANPSHNYTTGGVYTVSLIASNAYGAATNTKPAYITVLDVPPVANFTAIPSSGPAPLNVTFTDTSTGVRTSWAWSFGDGGTTNIQNTSHIYTNAGSFTAQLIVCNSGGCSTNTAAITATSGSTPEVAFSNYYGVAANTADSDGDGVSNTNEFLAGFNPTNSSAYARVISIARSGSDINITYLGSNGDTNYAGGPSIRTNVLEFGTGSANGSYTTNIAGTVSTDVRSNGTGAGTSITVTDTGGATNVPSHYYRVRVVAP